MSDRGARLLPVGMQRPLRDPFTLALASRGDSSIPPFVHTDLRAHGCWPALRWSSITLV